jgi:hypothetical protein
MGKSYLKVIDSKKQINCSEWIFWLIRMKEGEIKIKKGTIQDFYDFWALVEWNHDQMTCFSTRRCLSRIHYLKSLSIYELKFPFISEITLFFWFGNISIFAFWRELSSLNRSFHLVWLMSVYIALNLISDAFPHKWKLFYIYYCFNLILFSE